MLRLVLKLIHRLFFKKSRASGVLLIQPLPGIGDVIWYLPHLHAIADACDSVSLLTKPRSFADIVLKTDSSVESVIWLERNPGKHSGLFGFFRLVRELRKRNYAQAWILHGSSRYAWITYLAGIPETFGYGNKFQKHLLSRNDCFLNKKELATHGIQRANLLLKHAKIPVLEKHSLLRFDDYESNAVQCVKRYSLASKSVRKFSFAVGSSAACKQWGEDNFAVLADFLITTYKAQIILIGGPDEQEIIDAIVSRSKSDVECFVVLAGIPLEDVTVILTLCDACVGNDTGVLNISAATGTHSFGLFGSTTPLSYSECLHPVIPLSGLAPSSLQQQTVNRMHEISVTQVSEQIEKVIPLK